MSLSPSTRRQVKQVCAETLLFLSDTGLSLDESIRLTGVTTPIRETSGRDDRGGREHGHFPEKKEKE